MLSQALPVVTQAHKKHCVILKTTFSHYLFDITTLNFSGWKRNFWDMGSPYKPNGTPKLTAMMFYDNNAYYFT